MKLWFILSWCVFMQAVGNGSSAMFDFAKKMYNWLGMPDMVKHIEVNGENFMYSMCGNFIDQKLANSYSEIIVPSYKDFNYNEKGPSTWRGGCSGQHQSPIDISPADIEIRNFPWPLKFNNYWYKAPPSGPGNKAPPNQERNPKKPNLIMKNTGNTVEVGWKWRENQQLPWITGGPLGNRTYQFDQLHFHWNVTNTAGSEHTVGGAGYSMEAHLVHHDLHYETLKRAANFKGGIAIVTFFLQASSKTDNPDFSAITEKLHTIVDPLKATEVTYDKAISWFRDVTHEWGSNYVTYNGSLTTPPCIEDVIWIIFLRPVSVSSAQVNEFRKVRGEFHELDHNLRPVQKRSAHIIGSVTHS